MEFKLLPSAKINSKKLLSGSSFVSNDETKSFDDDSISVSKKDLTTIKDQVFEIKNLVTNLTTLKKKNIEANRIKSEQEQFEKKESKLEERKKPEDNKIKLPQAPKLGFLDRVKNFVLNTLFGFILVRLIKHLPKLVEVVKFLGGTLDFFTDIGGKLLDGLATFIQKGYEAYDFTKKTLKTFGGENAVKLFDGFNTAVGDIITAAIAASFALADMSGGGDGGGDDTIGIKGKTPGRSKRGIDSKLARRYAQRFGKDAAIKKFGQEGVRSLGGKYARSGAQNLARKGVVSLLGKGGTKTALKIVKPLVKNIPLIGGIMEFVLSWMSGDSVGKAAFKGTGATLGTWIGGALGSLIPIPGVGTAIGMWLGSVGGSKLGEVIYDKIFNNKDPKGKKQDVVKAAGGGQTPVTRAGRIVSTAPKRTIKKTKAKRQIAIQPTPLKPGANVGGDYEVQKVFPRSEFTGEVSPLNYIEQVYEKTSDDRLFGPLLNLQTKALVGQNPSKLDYRNAAQGLSNWMNMTFSDEILRTGALYAAGGGQIDAELLAKKSGDMTDAIARSLEDSISKRMSETINDLMKQMTLLEPEYYEEEFEQESGGDYEEEFDQEGGGTSSPTIWAPMLDLISSGEGGYSSVNPSLNRPEILNMTISELVRFQHQSKQRHGGSAAVGRYQFILPEYAAKLAGLSMNDKFTPENQDKMAVAYLEKKRRGKEWLSGKISTRTYIEDLAREWGAFRSYSGYVLPGNSGKIGPEKIEAALNKVKSGRSTGGETTRVPREIGETSLQGFRIKPASHSETGSGWTIEGQTDQKGRPIVFSREGAVAFAKMMKDSKGVVNGKDIASSQRSKSYNASPNVRGAEDSTHLYGRGMDIHGRSKEWIKANGAKYGWNWAPYGGPRDHGGHFEFSGPGGRSYDSSEETTTVSRGRTTTSRTRSSRSRGSRRSGSRMSRIRRSRSNRIVERQNDTSASQSYGQEDVGSGRGTWRFGRTGRLSVQPGWSHAHFDGTNESSLTRDMIPLLKKMASSNLKPELSNGTPILSGKDNKYYEGIVRSGISQHTHRPGPRMDVNMPGFPLIPFPLKYSFYQAGGAGHAAVVPGSGKTSLFHMSKKSDGSAFRGKLIPKDGNYFLHRGEFVVDKDSVDIFGSDFISTLNEIENKSQLRQRIGSLIEHLKYTADYEPGGETEVEVEIPEPKTVYVPTPIPFVNETPSITSNSGYDYDYTQSLYAFG